jgi:hypothetical protein
VSVLVITKWLDRQRLQRWLLFGEHGRHRPLGPAMDARIGPVFFPVIQICLRLFQALEPFAFQWPFLCMGDTAFDFSLSIWIPHLQGSAVTP